MTALTVTAAVLMAAVTTELIGARAARVLRPVRRLGSTTDRPAHHAIAHRWRPGRRDADDGEVAEWCEHVAAALRGGRSLTSAIADTDASWSRPILPSVSHAVRRGRSLADALDEVPADSSTPCGLTVPVLSASARLGGPAASSIERVAITLQARAAERAERRSASAQARLSALVLTIVPFAVLAFLAAAEPTVRTALHSSVGVLCLGAGALLNLGGWWWMRRLIGRSS